MFATGVRNSWVIAPMKADFKRSSSLSWWWALSKIGKRLVLSSLFRLIRLDTNRAFSSAMAVWSARVFKQFHITVKVAVLW